MAFNFGGGGGGGFSFPTSTTASSGFSFSAATPSTTAGSAGGGGFSFVTPATSQATSTAPAPFSFTGTPAATTTTTAATPGGFSFSNTSGSTSGGGMLSGAPQTSAPASAFNFSAPATTTANPILFTGLSSGLSSNFFNTAPTTTAVPVTAPLSSFNFQNKPVGSTAPEPAKLAPPTTIQSTLAFTTKPATGSTQGFLGTPATTTITTVTPAATGAVPTGLPSLFPAQTQAATTTTTTGTITTATATTTITTTASATLGLTTTSLSTTASATTTALATLTTATSTSSGNVVGGPGIVVRGGTLSVAGLEEKVNKWVSEMREQEERLLRQAAHVNAWDQLLQQGHDQVQALRQTLNKVKTDQTRLEAELDFIQGQQQELEQVVEPLEVAAAATTPAQHQGDRQRENMHLLAQNLDSQLRQMTDDLCKVIEHLNSNNSGSQASDPVNTVARVLSAHMDTLKWVDQNVALLNQKVDDLSKVSESKRRD